MSQNPFKIIRSTDLPPENLRNEVLGSVKAVMLLMRVVQLFVADPGSALFENVRILGRGASSRPDDPAGTPTDPTKTTP